jgi:hypothetical protein
MCHDLEATARRNVLKKLDTFPPGLNALYERMMQQISASDDAEVCRQVLASTALVYRPTTLDVTAVKQCRIGCCGSTLVLLSAVVVMLVYRSSQLRGKCTCPSGSACYNRISCDSAHVVTLEELMVFIEPLEDMANKAEVRKIVSLCRSFLSLREGTVYFVHQSAKDFLFAQTYNEVFPHRAEAAHHVIFSRSFAILSQTLRRDMYSLEALGVAIEEV